jgi:glycosyltransferase involved in cell wall biosynthesis
MLDSPFISIIIPTYNRAGLIGETIESFLAQTYEDFELIIVDDGSKDNTAEVVGSYKDSRVRYLPKANGERGAARNYGVKAARGTYITFIDSDDIAYPIALERARQQFEKLGDPACFALRYEVRVKKTGEITMPPNEIRSEFANQALKYSNVLACIGVFMKREIALSLPFEEDRQFAGTEDWLLWLKLGARYPIPYSSEICYCYFQHDDRSVMSFSEEKLRYRAEHIRKYLLEDGPSVKAYGTQTINRIYAHMLTYASLHLAMSRKPGRALHYLRKGIQADFYELFRRRTLGIFKTMLLGA